MMQKDAIKAFARALARDVKENPEILAFIDTAPPGQMGRFMFWIKRDLAREARGDFSKIVFPNVRAVFRRGLEEESTLRSGLSFIGEVLSVALPALFEAGSAIYIARENRKAQEDIAKFQAAVESEKVAARKAEAEARKAEAEAAMKIAARQETPTVEEEAEILERAKKKKKLPGWVIPVAVVGAGAVALVAAKG